MKTGIQFSKNWEAVRSRIRRAPKIAQGVADMQRKRDANELVSIWRDGLTHNTFHLEPLKPKTKARKNKLGYRYPSSPLYGLGLEGAWTYIKGMRVFRKKNGWTVHMINGKHHDSKLSLKALFTVHEYGATIKTEHAVIRIPARPAMQKSYTRILNRLKANDPVKEFAQAMNEYIRHGRNETQKKIEARAAEAAQRNE